MAWPMMIMMPVTVLYSAAARKQYEAISRNPTMWLLDASSFLGHFFLKAMAEASTSVAPVASVVSMGLHGSKQGEL